MDNKVKIVQADALRNYCIQLFEKLGVPKDEAFVNADLVVDADLCGVESHGVTRMNIYLKRLKLGATRPALEMKVVTETPAIAVLDACNSMGGAVSKKAMELAIEKAKKVGISFISVHNSNHNGMAAYWTKMALEHNMIGYSSTNGASRVAPWGGRVPLLGTNPVSHAIPAGKQLPIIPDQASCVVARGKVQLALARKQPIPQGWAMDIDGAETTDAKAALAGTIFPFGSYKGSGVAVTVEVMTGILGGGAFSEGVKDMYGFFDGPTAISHYFGAIDIATFGSVQEFKDKVDQLVVSIKNSPKAQGIDEIFLPGEIELRRKALRLKEGIPLSVVTLEDLQRLGQEYGVPCTL
ncbi:MAG: Ldh family oxidoreductase [Negativicutes bacterium]|nr:Ldh family oxidoreductase [Negativicutes bacterium]